MTEVCPLDWRVRCQVNKASKALLKREEAIIKMTPTHGEMLRAWCVLVGNAGATRSAQLFSARGGTWDLSLLKEDGTVT